jgi:hypothetical protein
MRLPLGDFVCQVLQCAPRRESRWADEVLSHVQRGLPTSGRGRVLTDEINLQGKGVGLAVLKHPVNGQDEGCRNRDGIGATEEVNPDIVQFGAADKCSSHYLNRPLR